MRASTRRPRAVSFLTPLWGFGEHLPHREGSDKGSSASSSLIRCVKSVCPMPGPGRGSRIPSGPAPRARHRADGTGFWRADVIERWAENGRSRCLQAGKAKFERASRLPRREAPSARSASDWREGGRGLAARKLLRSITADRSSPGRGSVEPPSRGARRAIGVESAIRLR